MLHREKAVAQFVALSAATGALVPWATTALGIVFGSLPRTDPFGLVVVFACWLLWPPMPDAAELERMGAPTGQLIRVLAIGSLTNAVMYAVVGTLLWYALYRRRWAWLPLIGLLAVFWWPGHALVFR